MRSRLLPWPRRAVLHLRDHGGPLAVVVGAAAAFLALEAAMGRISGAASIPVIVFGVPLVLSAGGLGVRSGAATLWVQKPVDPFRYYLAGAARNVIMSVGTTILLLAVLGIVALLLGRDPPTHPIWVICSASAVPLVVASMASGASMWLPRTGWLITLAALALTLFLQVSVLLDPALVDQPWVRLTRSVLPPWESLVSLLDLDALDGPTATRAIVRILVYAAVWIGGGVLGLRRLMTSGALTRTGSS